jgi:hypothetical protein
MSASNNHQEWTQVTRKSRKSNKHNKSKSSSHINSRSVGPQTENLRDPSDLEKDYNYYRSYWEAGVPCSELREFIKAKAASLKDINRAVNFGTGSFDPHTDGIDPKKAAFLQLAAFEIIIEELGMSYLSSIHDNADFKKRKSTVTRLRPSSKTPSSMSQTRNSSPTTATPS